MTNGTPPSVAPADDTPQDPPRPKPVIGSGASPHGRRYNIHDLARLTGISPRTIKDYRARGLVSPPLGPGRKGAYYDSGHLRQLLTIQRALAGKLTQRDFAELFARVEQRRERERVSFNAAVDEEYRRLVDRRVAARRGRLPDST